MGYDVLLSPGEAEDFERAPRLARLTVLHTLGNGMNLTFLKKVEGTGRCINLRGPLGDAYCAIYSERPSLCHEFEPGCPDCIVARRQFGIEPAEVPAGA